ncbi:MAG: hypothetical protein U0X91_02040 [Spirosomataceae bacterium]
MPNPTGNGIHWHQEIVYAHKVTLYFPFYATTLFAISGTVLLFSGRLHRL